METPPSTADPTPAPTPAPDPTPPTTPPPSQPTAPEVPPENRAREFQRKAEKAEREAAAARKRVEELEDRDRSEVEKAQRKLAEAEKKAAEAEARATKLERSSWVREAARKANFVDPEDAVALSRLDEIESTADAEAKVAALAEEKKHLVASATGPTQIGRVSSPRSEPEVPTDAEGKPDYEKGLAQELVQGLFGGR